LLLLAAAFLAPLFSVCGAAAGSYQLIYTFKGSPDGAAPEAGVAMDAEGRLYGTTIGGGVRVWYGVSADASGFR
jgi:hypothetical protein